MADDKKHTDQNGYLMLNGPDDTLWIPRSSNKSWLTLFYKDTIFSMFEEYVILT